MKQLSKLNINLLPFKQEHRVRVECPLAWGHYDLHLSMLNFKTRLVALPQNERSGFEITPGSEKSLGSCSYVRINLSIHLKSEQYGLTTLTTLGNWFGLPEN